MKEVILSKGEEVIEIIDIWEKLPKFQQFIMRFYLLGYVPIKRRYVELINVDNGKVRKVWENKNI